jgi:hypothetical protein
MARGYSSAREQVAGREDSFGNTLRLRDYISFNDQCLAEKALRAEDKSTPMKSIICENGAWGYP